MKEERIGPHRLILGDCREVMPGLAGKYDAILADPPYGVGYVHSGGGRGVPKLRLQGGKPSIATHHRHANRPIIGDDLPFDPAPFMSKPAILWGANHFSSRLPHGRWLAWNKLADKDPWDSFSDVEFAWQNVRGKDCIFSLLWKGLCRAGDDERAGAAASIKSHPTQKPVALMRWCLGFLPDAHTILDPFMGSGTTIVACQKEGRAGIGIELDPEYFDIACRRVDEAMRQPDLFIAAPEPPTQESLI